MDLGRTRAIAELPLEDLLVSAERGQMRSFNKQLERAHCSKIHQCTVFCVPGEAKESRCFLHVSAANLPARLILFL